MKTAGQVAYEVHNAVACWDGEPEHVRAHWQRIAAAVLDHERPYVKAVVDAHRSYVARPIDAAGVVSALDQLIGLRG